MYRQLTGNSGGEKRTGRGVVGLMHIVYCMKSRYCFADISEEATANGLNGVLQLAELQRPRHAASQAGQKQFRIHSSRE